MQSAHRDPAAVCCAPEGVLWLHVKHVLGGHACHDHVTTCSTDMKCTAEGHTAADVLLMPAPPGWCLAAWCECTVGTGLQTARLLGQALPDCCRSAARLVLLGNEPSTVQLGPFCPSTVCHDCSSHKAAAHVSLTHTEPQPNIGGGRCPGQTCAVQCACHTQGT